MLPEWAPNIHPLVVHFPIALFFVAFAVDVAGLVLRRIPGLRTAAVALYTSGAVGALVSYVTGNQAADSVVIPTAAIAAVNDHQDLALYTVIFFSVYAALRIGLMFAVKTPAMLLRVPLTLVAIAGLFLIWQTGESGGRLVFQHGIGVQAVVQMADELQALREQEFARQVAVASPIVGERGSWVWRIAPGAGEALGEAFTFVEGTAGDIQATVAETDEGPELAIRPMGRAVMFVIGEPLSSLDMEAVLDASDFEGTVSLVHNVVDAANYHFLRLGERLVQGRVVNGREETLAAGDRRAEGWMTLRATGDRGHFYGYEQGRTVAHGHSATPAAGLAGLRIEGTGELRLRRMEVQAVR